MDSSTLAQPTGAILRLSDDILIEIFRQLRLVTNDASLALTRVCSRWRTTTINDPFLWSYVKITPTTIGQAKTVLAWSRSLTLLKIDVECSQPMTLYWLQDYAPRIQELSFTGDAEISFPYNNLDRLQHLDLNSQENALRTWCYARELPSLRHLTLNETPILLSTWVSLPVFQITHLIVNSLEWFDATRIFPLLMQSKELQNLKFGLRSVWQDTITFPVFSGCEPIILPHLQYLTLGLGSMTSIFLEPLVLPRLERISIYGARDWLDSVKSLAERSSFNLTHFFMNQCSPIGERADLMENDWDDQIIQILRCVPSIEKFHSIDSGALGKPLIEALTTKEGTAGLLGPSLKAFSITNVGSFKYTEISVDELVSAFKSRSQAAGLSVDEERNVIVLHHDQNMAEEELKRVRISFLREEPSYQYARHLVFGT